MPVSYSYPQLLTANEWIRKSSDSFYWQCTTRTVQESKLFPVNPYIALSYYNAWYRWPELIRKIEAAMPAEEIADRTRETTMAANIVSASLIPNFYLGGRQFLIDMGMLRPTDALDDVMTVLDFSRRLNLSFHRNHAHALASDAGHRAQLLPERTTQVFEADALPTRPGDRLHTAVTQFLAAASQYAFLKNCECRLGIHNSGPYRTHNDGQMLVRDFVDLAEGDLPWLDGVAAGLEHNNLTLPIIMTDTEFPIVDDWASFEASPAYDPSNMVAVGLYTSDYLSEGYLPVHMGSATELADYLDALRDQITETTSALWQVMAGWTREQMIDAGALVYYSVLKDLAHVAGVYEQEDWWTLDERANRFKALLNDEYGNHAIAEVVGFISLSSQQNSEYHMAKHSGARGEMWSLIPYSVLSDDAWTSSVGPLRPASSTLPAKTSTWTTTRGRLKQDECNALAREFTPATLDPTLRHLDDGWVKTHPHDPRADELYRRTQQHSIVLAGAGAGLSQADIAARRTAAGRA